MSHIERTDASGNTVHGRVVRKMPRGKVLVEWEDGPRSCVNAGQINRKLPAFEFTFRVPVYIDSITISGRVTV